MSRRTWRFWRRSVVKQTGRTFSADLGGSSNYKYENYLSRSWKWFQMKSISIWV